MGEDRVTFAEKKNGDVLPCRQRHSSVISSCSEDAESESTSTGYPPTPDEEREEELEYGPGIVNKLRTRFLTISLKQNRGSSMRRSCSMENLLDQDRPCRNNIFSQNRFDATGKESEEHKSAVWGNLKRAKSMDTLLMDLQPEPPPCSLQPEMNGDSKKEPKIVRRRDGGLLRTGPTICDEELPKPDTVKTYKRMFEPAESRRGSYSRRPPVLRASAKSGTLSVSKINGVSSSAKVNGTVSKNKLSAKQSPSTKAQPDSESIISNNSNINQPQINGEDSKPVCNGSFVKAIPMKITDSSLCNGNIEKTVEKDISVLNHSVSMKEVHNNQKNGNVCNGNSTYNELIIEKSEEYIKPDVKKLVNQTNKIVKSGETPLSSVVNGINSKPKIPPNRPAFVKNVRPATKISDLNGVEKKNPLIPKLKPVVASKKVPEIVKSEMNIKPEEIVPNEPRVNGDVKEDPKVKEIKPAKDENKIVEQNNRKNVEKVVPEQPEVVQSDKTDSTPVKELEKGNHHHLTNGDIQSSDKTINSVKSDITDIKPESKPVKKQQSSESITTSMVFDFRGKDVVPHVAVLPVPFGCKALHPKKRPLLIDGKEAPNGNGVASDDDDEYHMDYSVPPPCGVKFEGENVKIGKGAILATRNKEVCAVLCFLKVEFNHIYKMQSMSSFCV